MAVPKKRTSLMKKRMRRTHDALKVPSYVSCPNCKSPKRPHHICESCGRYKGKEIIRVGEL